MSTEKELSGANFLGANAMFRPLESITQSRTLGAFPGLEVVGEQDDVLKQPLEVTMTEDWKGYMNEHIMMHVAKYYVGRIIYWRFLPDPVNSQIIFVQAQSDKEYGATKVEYSETESGTTTNLRQPMQKLGVKRLVGRVRSFKLVVRIGADNKEYLALTLVDSTSRPVVSKKKKSQPSATGTTGAAGPATGTSSAGNTTPGETASPAATAAPVAAAVGAPPTGSDVASAVQTGSSTLGKAAPAGGEQKSKPDAAKTK